MSPVRRPEALAGRPPEEKMMNLRRGTFEMNFKRGKEPIPEEITGPIVGMYPITRYSYEIIWLEEEQPKEGSTPPEA